MKKFLLLAVLCSVLFAGSVFAAQPEDALSSRHDDSVYMVLRVEDTPRLMKWVLSREHFDLFGPMILGRNADIQLALGYEFVSRLLEVMPIRSAAMITGTTRAGAKQKMPAPFFQAAFTVSPEFEGLLDKIADGIASASDIADLLVGDKTASVFTQTMLKVERDKDNILRVNNDIYMSAKDGVVLVGSSVNEIRLAVRALKEPDTRLLAKFSRRFTEKDFALLHIDYDTMAEFDTDKELEELNLRKYLEKPFEVEFAFHRVPDKFTMSVGMNMMSALKKKYADVLRKQAESMKKTAGGFIDLEGTGNSTSPLAALGTQLDFAVLKENDVWKPVISRLLRNLRVRFGISEEETASILTGPFSAVVNGTVPFESFKLPAVYMSMTGTKGAAAKVYEKLIKSPHFSKVQDGVLQLDTSISPVACLAVDRGEKLGVDFAEVSSLAEKPTLKPALAALMEREAIASMWADFEGIQSWLNDSENGVFTTLAPIAAIMGYSRQVKALRDVLAAEFSLPSVAIWGDSPEVIHAEFAVKEIDYKKGLIATIINVYRELNRKPEKPANPDKTE